MGFSLWTDGDVAWAAGTYEYRAMGIAVIAATDQFRATDFRSDRRRRIAASARFAGYFASLGQINAHLRARRAANSSARKS